MASDQADTSKPIRFKPISGADVDKFLIWCASRDFGPGPQIANKDVLDAFGGFSVDDVRWLAQACIQAKTIPDLVTMARAILARDVAILRSDNRNT